MPDETARARSPVSLSLGVSTLLASAALLAWNLEPNLFPDRAHKVLGALPLGLIAVAYLAYQAPRRLGWRGWLKATLLAAAFLFWAANQLWPDAPRALLYNDVAIVLFVLDIFFVLIGWPGP